MNPEFWNARFGEQGYAYGTEPNDFLRAEAHRIPLAPRGEVLCLAEGEGRNAVFLAGLGHRVTALDFSVAGLRKTEQLAEERGVQVELMQADLSTWEGEPDRYLAIVSIWAHLPSAIRARLHATVVGSLSPGGCFLLEAYSPAQLALGTGGPKDVDLLMSADALRKECAPLRLDVLRELEREVHEGPFHGGKSAVVQLVGVRA